MNKPRIPWKNKYSVSGYSVLIVGRDADRCCIYKCLGKIMQSYFKSEKVDIFATHDIRSLPDSFDHNIDFILILIRDNASLLRLEDNIEALDPMYLVYSRVCILRIFSTDRNMHGLFEHALDDISDQYKIVKFVAKIDDNDVDRICHRFFRYMTFIFGGNSYFPVI